LRTSSVFKKIKLGLILAIAGLRVQNPGLFAIDMNEIFLPRLLFSKPSLKYFGRTAVRTCQ
jgi:hypothetical protein